ncbi:MAG: hypothetical protein EU549_02885 [Promethearchaeota archaeon]|nr:MAG: hypothetical protein EU549_02885 [Candidatus Lokiarchaeota archaeon]
MTEKLKYYSSSFFFLFLSSVINILFLMISKIIIARFSNLEIYGFISVVISEGQTLSVFLAIGLFSIIRIELPRNNNFEKFSRIVSSILYFLIFSTLSFITSLILFNINSKATFAYSFFLCSIINFYTLAIMIFSGLKKFHYVFGISLIQNLFFFFLIFISRNNLNVLNIVNYLFLSYLLSYILPIFIGFFFIYKNGKFDIKQNLLNFNFRIEKAFIFNKQRLYLYGTRISVVLQSYLLLKVPQFLGYTIQSAYLSISHGVPALLLIIPNIVDSLISPLISKQFSLNKKTRINQIIKEGFMIIYLLLGMGLIILSFHGDFIIIILYNEKYLESAGIIFYIFLIGIIMESLTIPLKAIFINSNQEKIFAAGRYILLISFLLSLSILLLILNEILLAVSMSFIIGFIMELIVFIYYIKKKTQKILLNLKNILKWLIIVISSIFLGMFSSLIFNFPQTIKFIILCCNLLIFILFLWLTDLVSINEIFKNIKSLLFEKFRIKS